ncbi:MAG: hypothetical protein HY810_01275 [Candidatus Omnitrophica bacterium]|nr:hypothetical protein [Candidatus Omnitrophota bacterium]
MEQALDKFSKAAGIFLLVLNVVILVVLIFIFSRQPKENRYDFKIQERSNEIYVFDKQAGKLYITAPQVIGEYSDEVWTELDPTQEGRTLSFKEFLRSKAKMDLRNKFIQDKKQLENLEPQG